jgi:Acetyltransferase (GNAT) domain
MNARTWNTRDAIAPEFERAWRERLSRTPHAHFGFDPAFLRWESDHGRSALAALVEEGPGRGALVLREHGAGRVCGWPWRWEAVIEDAGRTSPRGLTPAECDWLFGAAVELSGGRRLHCYLPDAPETQAGGFPAGTTLLRSLDLTDEQMLMTMDVNKRRAVKRAQREGFTVVPATTHQQFLAFARLQVETEKRRGQESGAISSAPPLPGEGWREWELPWMLLLVAERDGQIACGSGYGLWPGGMIDYRANASTLEGKKLGANALLAFEAMRLARSRGCRWMNWGGATDFKRELGGERVDLTCRLGGGVLWALPNRITVSLRRARPVVASWLRSLRPNAARRSA